VTTIIQLNSQCNKTTVPLLGQPQLIYLLTELTPEPASANIRLPLNFTLLLDKSYSMDASKVPNNVRQGFKQQEAQAHSRGERFSISWDGSRLRNMKEAVKNIIDQLNPEDIVSIVAFSETADVLVPSQPASSKAALKRKVDNIATSSYTNLAAGLSESIRQAQKYQRDQQVNRIILLTDGDATDDENASRHLAGQAGSLGIPIVCLGFGDDWNEDFLINLADLSMQAPPGSHTGYADYIPSPDQAVKIFQQVYQSMQVVAQDVTLTIRMAKDVEARRVWQVVPMINDISRSTVQGRSVVASIGELEKGGAGFLFELMLPPRPAGAVRFAQATVDYLAPGMGPQREASDLVVNYAPGPQVPHMENEHVMNIVEKVQAFKLQTQALQDIDAGNVRSATQKLRQAVTILLDHGETEIAQQMQHEADHLEQSGQMSGEAKKTIKLTSRKTIKLSD
jgi:Ca-activated chloride channel homolog